jgi:hypothetical protein
MSEGLQTEMIIASAQDSGFDLAVPIFGDEDFYRADTPVALGTFLPTIDIEASDTPTDND